MRSGFFNYLGRFFFSPEFNNYPDAVAVSIASKMVSWWDFDGNANDVRGLNNLSGTATYSAGLVGSKAVKTSRLTKSSASITPAMTTLSGVGGLSICAWVYIAGTGGEDIELRTTSAEAYRLAVRNGNQIFFIVGSSSPVTISSSVGAVSVGTWNMIVGTVSAVDRSLNLYVNGSLVATGTAATSINPTDISFGRVTGNVFNALHNDSTGLFTAVLTAAEVAWLYNAALGRASSELPGAPAGAWTWYTDSRAIRLPSGRIVLGTVERDGVVTVGWTDDGGETYSRYAATGSGTPDDHDNPALLRRSDGKILFFQTRHNSNNYLVGISTSIDDPSSFTVSDIASAIGGSSYSYSNPFEMTGESGSPILNFYRSGVTPTWGIYFSKSTDGGVTWAAQTKLLNGAASSGRPYLKAVKNGANRIDFAVTDGHPDSVATNSIRHFYYQNGNYYKSDGTLLGAPPYNTDSDLTTIYNGATNRAWIHDIKIGSDGHPRVVFAVFPSTSDHRYYYGRWTGSAWVTAQICTAGGALYPAEPYYSGGVCIDSDNVNVVYASRGLGSGRWAMYQYVTVDGGATFAEADMGFDGMRPYHIKGSGVIAVMNGRYVTFSNYITRIGLVGADS